MVQLPDGKHTECFCSGVDPTFGEATRGAFVERKWKPAAAGKLEGGISHSTGEAPEKGTVPGTDSRSPPLEEGVVVPNETSEIVDRTAGLLKVKKILSRKDFNPLDEIRRPCYRVRRRDSPEKILVLARKTYKVYADIGPTIGLMSRVLSVLDTGAGPNLVRKSELPPGMETLISFGPTQDIGDANNRPLRTLGTIRMPVRLGRFVAAADFNVCEKLGLLLILGADYCDRFIEAIYPRRKKVELAGF